jgi:hypothetical protein
MRTMRDQRGGQQEGQADLREGQWELVAGVLLRVDGGVCLQGGGEGVGRGKGVAGAEDGGG